MRWEGLFDDLEGQLAAQERLELDAEVAERTRRERALVTLASRLAASRGVAVRLHLADGTRLEGTVADVGQGWLLLDRAGARPSQVLVPDDALVGVTGLAQRAHVESRVRRLGLGSALRALARDRTAVRVRDRAGGEVTGTVDGVGADHLDLAEHAPDLPRRAGNVTGRRSVPFAAVLCVESL